MKTVPKIVATMSLFLSLPALAGEVSILEVKGAGPVKVGREGAWKDAPAGTAIAESDFLNVGAKTTVVVKLASGSPVTLDGRLVLPGRRLMDPKATPDLLLRFAKVMQRAADAIGGTAETSASPGGRKGNKEGEKSVKEVRWASQDDGPAESPADAAEAALAAAKPAQAQAKAEAILRDSGASPLEARRARIVLGKIAGTEAAFESALGYLNAAAAPVGKEEADGAEWRARALVARGELLLQMGEEGRAGKDFREAVGVAPTSSYSAGAAHYFLGAIALAASDSKTADAELAQVGDHPDLKQKAEELRKSY